MQKRSAFLKGQSAQDAISVGCGCMIVTTPFYAFQPPGFRAFELSG
jgi:hypothetical protein